MDDLVEFLVARVMDESHAYVVGTLGGEALLGSRLPMLDLIERLPVIRPTPRLPAGMTPMAIQGDRPWLDDGPYGVVARRARPDGAGRGAGGVEADVVVGAEWPDEAVAVREETLEALGRFGVDVGRVYALDRFRPDVDHAFRLALGGRRVPYEDVGSPSGFRVTCLSIAVTACWAWACRWALRRGATYEDGIAPLSTKADQRNARASWEARALSGSVSRSSDSERSHVRKVSSCGSGGVSEVMGSPGRAPVQRAGR
ncbi:hypothetical protein [Streptomyces halstedii]|uniref:hypothetical protein n=1 Tax=Streptomyces halstedii TaxID=1944 RepID=UPI00345FF45B